MLKRTLLAAAVIAAAACSPPAQRETTEAPQAPPQELMCNAVMPDLAKQVSVVDALVTVAGAELRGGRIAPGMYDLANAQRIAGATGWQGTRAIALEVTEDLQTGVVTLNWAGTTPTNVLDRWTATLAETPAGRLSYSCGRIGDVDASYAASESTLELRLADGANGALQLTFERR